MLGLEAQQRAREALRKVDQSLQTLVTREDAVQKQAQSFRDNLFGSFQFLESETMTMQELQIQVKREGKQQLLVTSRGRPSFTLVFDPEMAYDSKPQPAEGSPQSSLELGMRLFAVLMPPGQGLLRYYTIFADGSWKRTTFAIAPDGLQARSAIVPHSGQEVLVLEAVDLLGYACMVHPTWATLAADAETFTLNNLLDRTRTKIHLNGLGTTRR